MCQLDAKLGEHGGVARFDMDDGYVVAPAAAAFAAAFARAAAKTTARFDVGKLSLG